MVRVCSGGLALSGIRCSHRTRHIDDVSDARTPSHLLRARTRGATRRGRHADRIMARGYSSVSRRAPVPLTPLPACIIAAYRTADSIVDIVRSRLHEAAKVIVVVNGCREATIESSRATTSSISRGRDCQEGDVSIRPARRQYALIPTDDNLDDGHRARR